MFVVTLSAYPTRDSPEGLRARAALPERAWPAPDPLIAAGDVPDEQRTPELIAPLAGMCPYQRNAYPEGQR